MLTIIPRTLGCLRLTDYIRQYDIGCKPAQKGRDPRYSREARPLASYKSLINSSC
ncbi:hypothetical protein GCM10010913_31670 [Paenibacillus aceti]|uniref:Uncharacterized protein n=1 Tax=Paenibacillus aceti TaxID=1820010 RepID=A0ABQ1W0I9_9BACL|nr:hypothetical protein GCM10010913_31670 [Paenibacillus aceti]